ncbi:unnamed protein product [Boreogadus saida]
MLDVLKPEFIALNFSSKNRKGWNEHPGLNMSDCSDRCWQAGYLPEKSICGQDLGHTHAGTT